MCEENDFVPVESWKHCGSEDNQKTININVRVSTINTWVGGTLMLIQCEDHIQCKKQKCGGRAKTDIYIYIYTYINLYTYLYLYKYTRRVNSQNGLGKRGQNRVGQ